MLSIGRLDNGHKYRFQTKHLAKLKTVYTEFVNQKMMCVSITTLEICVLQLDTCYVIKEDYLDVFQRRVFLRVSFDEIMTFLPSVVLQMTPLSSVCIAVKSSGQLSTQLAPQ